MTRFVSSSSFPVLSKIIPASLIFSPPFFSLSLLLLSFFFFCSWILRFGDEILGKLNWINLFIYYNIKFQIRKD